MNAIHVGDFVTIGNSTLTWEVCGLPELIANWAYLKSGQTGRIRFERLSNVRLHSRKESA